MPWQDGYDILGDAGGAGGADPLGILGSPGPQIGDVLDAAGAGTTMGEALTVSPTFSGTAGAPGFAAVGRLPAPGSKYPALGFDPATGDLSEVARLVSALAEAGHRLGRAHALVQRMQADQDSWQGEAAEAFHRKLSDVLPKYLEEGQQSLGKASSDLRGWQARLESYQAKARGYEADAQSARTAFGRAWADAVSTAADNKGSLALQGQHFDSDAKLRQADAGIKAALAAVEDATKRASSAYSSLQQVISEAKTLADTYSEDASAVARTLRADARDSAPHKPGFWQQAGDWLKDHGGDLLSAAAAVCGVVALFCPIFALPAILLSTGALGLHAWKFADEGKGSLFPVGKNWGNWLALGGDALGAVPGLGVAMDGVKALRVATEADEGLGLARTSGALWHRITEAGEKLGGDGAVSPIIQKPVTRLVDGTWEVGHQASEKAAFVGKAIQFHISASGAAFALAGLNPGTGEDPSFANANNAVGDGGSLVGVGGTAWDLIERLRR